MAVSDPSDSLKNIIEDCATNFVDSNSKEQKETMSEPKPLDLSTQLLPPGWRKIYVQRMAGKSAGKYDAYIYSPDGKKHRSKTDLLTYLAKRGIADQYPPDSFDFTVRSQLLAENVDSLSSGVLQTKAKQLDGDSSQEKLDVQTKARKRKAENGSKKRMKVKRSSLDHSENGTISDILDKKELKKLKKLAVSSCGRKPERQEKLSTSKVKKSKVSSPAKRLKHSTVFKFPRKLKIKLNFSPRIKREADRASELTAKSEPPCSGLGGKSSEPLGKERLDGSLCRSLEGSAEARPFDVPVCSVSCERLELFSDIGESQLHTVRSALDCDEGRLESVENDPKSSSSLDDVSGTKTFPDLEISPDPNSLGVCGSEINPSIFEECNNNTSIDLDSDIESSQLFTEVKTETDTDQSRGKITDDNPFSVDYFTIAEQETHSGSELPKMEKWIPPQSPYNLIEESLDGNLWKVLVTSIFMDSKETCLAESGFPKRTVRQFFRLCPTPETLQLYSTKKICKILKQVILSEDTIITIKKFSEEYLTTKWQDPTTLCGITSYGKDSYRMFCINKWKQVAPENPKLRMYHKWLWQNHRTLGIN